MSKRLHLATARDETLVHEWAERLRTHGIDAVVVPGDGSPVPDPDRWRILVPEGQWLRARALLGPAADQEID